MNKRTKDDIKLVLGILGLVTIVFLLSGGFDLLASAIRPDDYSLFTDFTFKKPEIIASLTPETASVSTLCKSNALPESGNIASAYYCEGTEWKTNINRGGFNVWGSINYGTNGRYCMGPACFPTGLVLINYASATTVKDFHGMDTKITGFTVEEGTFRKQDFVTETLSSRLSSDANMIETFQNGVFVGSGSDGGERHLTVSATRGYLTVITKIEESIPYASCSVGNGTILGVEVFSAGKTFSLYSFQRPVQRFCTNAPVLIQRSNGFAATGEVYEKLRRGEVLTVPENEQWAVFYLFRNDGTLPQCQTGQAYDFGRSSCTTASGFAFFCKGELDPNTGICSDTLQDRCDNVGGFWNTQEKICIYAFPVQALCAESSATFVPLYSKCISYLLNPSACSLAGGTYNAVKSWCEFPPVTTITCPLLELENGGFVETAYNPLTGQCQGSAPTAITCPLLELENGGSVQTVYNPSIGKCEGNAPAQINFKAGECNGVLEQVSAGVYTCTIPPTTTFKAGECTGILSQVSAGVYTCTIPPIISYEKPSCAGKLEEVKKGVYVCKLTATQVQQNITVQDPIVIQPFVFERIPAWVIYSVSAALILVTIYLITFRKKK